MTHMCKGGMSAFIDCRDCADLLDPAPCPTPLFARCGHPRTPDNVGRHTIKKTRSDGTQAAYPTTYCMTCKAEANHRRYEEKAGRPVERRGKRRPAEIVMCPECPHRLSLHDPNDGMRCYHRTDGEYDCECVLAERKSA
jgi:hypothetical protein